MTAARPKTPSGSSGPLGSLRPRSEGESRLAALLREALPGVRAVGPPWPVPFGGGPTRGTVSVEEGWVILDAPFRSPDPVVGPDPIALLETNASLGGDAKLVLDGHPFTVRARTEIPVDVGHAWEGDGPALVARIGAARAGLARAVEPGPDRRSSSRAAEGVDGLGMEPLDSPSLLALCRDSDWPGESAEDGTIRIPLEAPLRNSHREATLRPGGWAPRLRVQLLPTARDELDRRSQWAVGFLLLRTSATVRTVRAVAGPRDTATPFTGFEVALPRDPSPDDMGRGLSALSVATEMTASEVEALVRDPALASLYVDRSLAGLEQQPGLEGSADALTNPPHPRRTT